MTATGISDEMIERGAKALARRKVHSTRIAKDGWPTRYGDNSKQIRRDEALTVLTVALRAEL